MTKVLMISTDRKILEEGSSVRERMREYGKLFEELHIIVFSLRHPGEGRVRHGEGPMSQGRSATARGGIAGPASTPEPVIQDGITKISENVFVYPTNSFSKLFYVRDAIRIGSKLLSGFRLSTFDSVITTQDPFETGYVGRILSRRYRMPLHVQIHTDFASPFFKKGILNRIRIMLSKKNLAHASAVRVVSERIKRSLPAGIIGKASVLPIFADIESVRRAPVAVGFRQERFPFEKVVLMASRLTREKDIGTAMEAFAIASRAHPDAGLVIVGEGPEEGGLKSKVENLKLEGRVVFEPWMDRDTLSSYMKSADVFLSTSLFEGYGLSMLEAHAAGAALVATDAGIAPELTSYICEPRDVECLAKRLEVALSGQNGDKAYAYPYRSAQAYLEAYKADIERALA